MPMIDLPSGRALNVREMGAGPRVLLVHGWMTDGRVWDRVIDAIDGRLSLIVPDLAATGGSDPSDSYALDDQAADLEQVLAAYGDEPVIVVGHSMGGQISQKLALRAPERVRALALVCAVPSCGVQLPPEVHGLFSTSAGDRGKQGAILDAACTQLDDAGKTALLDGAERIPEACIVGAYEAWTGGFDDDLGGIDVPTLVVGTDDPFLPPAFLQQATVDPMPRAHLTVLKGPGHYPNVEAPGALAAIIEGFVAGLG